nr:MAG TPA: hypothetical protein [Caudoviricetes sp.]
MCRKEERSKFVIIIKQGRNWKEKESPRPVKKSRLTYLFNMFTQQSRDRGQIPSFAIAAFIVHK